MKNLLQGNFPIKMHALEQMFTSIFLGKGTNATITRMSIKYPIVLFLGAIFLSLTSSYAQTDSTSSGSDTASYEVSDGELNSLIDNVKDFIKEFSDVKALDHSIQTRAAAKGYIKDKLKSYYSTSGVDFTTISNLQIDEFWPKDAESKKGLFGCER